jgi:hypothetical protein
MYGQEGAEEREEEGEDEEEEHQLDDVSLYISLHVSCLRMQFEKRVHLCDWLLNFCVETIGSV